MTNPSSQIQLFLSYSRIDKAIARDLVAKLEARGLQVVADWDFGVGQFQLKIDDAIEACAIVAVLVSKNSGGSEEVEAEINHARSYHRDAVRYLPLLLDDTPIAGGLRRLKGHNWVDLRRGIDDDAISEIVELVSVETRGGSTASDTQIGDVLDDSELISSAGSESPNTGSVPPLAATTVNGSWVAISIGGQPLLVEAADNAINTRSLGGVARGRELACLDAGQEISSLAVSQDGTVLAAIAGEAFVVFTLTTDGELKPWPVQVGLPNPGCDLCAVRRVGNHAELLVRDGGSTLALRVDHRRSSAQASASDIRSGASLPNGFIVVDSEGCLTGPSDAPLVMALPRSGVIDVDVAAGGAGLTAAALCGDGHATLRAACSDATGVVSTRAMHLARWGSRVAVVRSTVQAEQPTMIAVETSGRVLVWAWDDLPETSE